MMRYWIGTALLAGSWLLGLNYFYPAQSVAWLAAVVVGAALLGNGRQRGGGRLDWAALALLLPAAWQAAFPLRAAPVLIIVGLAARLSNPKTAWVRRLGSGAIAAGVILFVQYAALSLYAAVTMRSHDLPGPLAQFLAAVASLLGIDAAADGPMIVMHSMRQAHKLAATWELLVDPASWLFFVGGATLLAMAAAQAADEKPSSRLRTWLGGLGWLSLAMVLWLPVRAGLMMAIYLQRVLLSDAETPLHAMNHLFSPWMLMALLAVPVLLVWLMTVSLPSLFGRGAEGEWGGKRKAKKVESGELNPQDALTLALSQRERGLTSEPRIPEPRIPEPRIPEPRIPEPPNPRIPNLALQRPKPQDLRPIPTLLIALAAATLTVAEHWDPPGARKQGRVMVVERHSQWEPTTKPYDTTWFVEPKLFDEGSGYNYERVWRYLGQYYETSQLLEKDSIDTTRLADCDVLIVKTPTVRYSPNEVEAVRQFVHRGGGLLLIGDHTNFERSSTIMNDLVRPMGFIFRDDLLFSFNKSPYQQSYRPPAVPHPIVAHLPPMDFAVSCSIEPSMGFNFGRAAIAATGLWSMGPEYHYSNFHPVPQHYPPMRFGAFVQTWSDRYGQGRVVAFTDSTIFSNFCAGQPGKSELLLGMVEWLNHRPPPIDPRIYLVPLGAGLLIAGLLLGRRRGAPWLLYLAAAACGWAIASPAVAALHRWQMPTPQRVRPETRVAIDRTTSAVPLSLGAYTQGKGAGYGIFEQWLARLDCHTVRLSGEECFADDVDVIVSICPNRPVPDWFRRRLAEFVAEGGRLIVIDSPDNAGSTANSLLWPFGLVVQRDQAWKGRLSSPWKVPPVQIASAWEISGGEPVARLDKLPVAAVARHGRGLVLAVGFGSLWNDRNMGDWSVEPDAAQRERYEAMFELIRPLIKGELPAARQPPRESSPDAGPKESGPAEL
jgi:hypothetical protein